MAAPEKPRISDEKRLECFRDNLAAMRVRLRNQPLHNYKRKIQKDDDWAREEERDHRPAFNALDLLPGYSTLQGYAAGNAAPTQEDVDRIADFCTQAFAFEEAVTAADLLTREINFPVLRPTQKWDRYKGCYRCFYFYPDLRLEESGGSPQLQGGLLNLWEVQGELWACFITGIRRDSQFPELERLMELVSKAYEQAFYAAFKSYNDRLDKYESRLVCYRGPVDTTVPGYLTLRLRRMDEVESNNVAFLFLRRFDKSAQPEYSGGIADVTLCRGSNLTSFAMVVVREELTMAFDGAFHARYLAEQSNCGRGIRITEDSEGHWNRAMLERVARRKERE